MGGVTYCRFYGEPNFLMILRRLMVPKSWHFVIPRTCSDVKQFVGADFLVHSAEIRHKKLLWIVDSISHTSIHTSLLASGLGLGEPDYTSIN